MARGRSRPSNFTSQLNFRRTPRLRFHLQWCHFKTILPELRRAASSSIVYADLAVLGPRFDERNSALPRIRFDQAGSAPSGGAAVKTPSGDERYLQNTTLRTRIKSSSGEKIVRRSGTSGAAVAAAKRDMSSSPKGTARMSRTRE